MITMTYSEPTKKNPNATKSFPFTSLGRAMSWAKKIGRERVVGVEGATLDDLFADKPAKPAETEPVEKPVSVSSDEVAADRMAFVAKLREDVNKARAKAEGSFSRFQTAKRRGDLAKMKREGDQHEKDDAAYGKLKARLEEQLAAANH